MNGSELKALWRSGTPSFGTWITLADPAVCAVMANIGFEWIVIDAEHHPFNPETLRNMIQTLNERGVVSVVRLRWNDTALVKQTLDWGAEGIIFPMIHDAAEAQQAVAACRYPPQGVRGFTPREASNYFKNLHEYLSTANDRILAIVQIEHADAVENIEGILQTPGLDGIFIGPADLSFSLGLGLNPRHPQVQEAISLVIERAKAHGIPIGLGWEDTVEGYQAFLAKGVNFLPVGADYDFMTWAGTKLLEDLRQATGGR